MRQASFRVYVCCPASVCTAQPAHHWAATEVGRPCTWDRSHFNFSTPLLGRWRGCEIIGNVEKKKKIACCWKRNCVDKKNKAWKTRDNVVLHVTWYSPPQTVSIINKRRIFQRKAIYPNKKRRWLINELQTLIIHEKKKKKTLDETDDNFLAEYKVCRW